MGGRALEKRKPWLITVIELLFCADGFYREFIYSGEESTFPCEEYGIRIRFPEHQVEREITMTVISLNTSGDDCTIECEDDAEFVSGIYRVRVSEPIPCPVTVQIQHCAIINTSEDTSTLTFLRSNTNEDYFAAIEGGKFDLESGYGQIELCQFSEFGIGRIFKRHGGTKYCASVFKKQREANTIDVHIVVTKNLAHHIRVSITVITTPFNPLTINPLITTHKLSFD